MRKNLFQISAPLATGIVAGSLSAAAQTERIVKLTTGKAVGSEITLLVNHTYEGVTVDWGDGNPVAYNTVGGAATWNNQSRKVHILRYVYFTQIELESVLR